MIYHGDCLEVLKTLPDNSVDSIVTDPPYDLTKPSYGFERGKESPFKRTAKGGFMGKEWDGTGIAFKVELWQECLRVLKPGGHLLAFGGTRTYHRMAVAIEDAGFEVRDMLEWIYASGFPKSLNVGKAVDKLQGNEREVGELKFKGGTQLGVINDDNWKPKDVYETKGNSEWEGFGTALKPAHEPICMARKPLSEKTIVENVLKHGTGAIDIDGCRIPTSELTPRDNKVRQEQNIYGMGKGIPQTYLEPNDLGRFPANIICTDDALNDGVMTEGKDNFKKTATSIFGSKTDEYKYNGESKSTWGSKSRYFDIDCWGEKHGLLQFPKASKRERNEGLDDMPDAERIDYGGFHSEKGLIENGRNPENRVPMKNGHPTVKPVHLMSWLVRLVTPPNGVCLDPFMGSGTTGVACKKLKRNFIGIEREAEYIKIAEARIKGTEDLLL